ncbi:MAG: methyl-accepting chemotaxis protein [Synergistaceae bacterium]|jgi:methyl-accepting chemotaxis protein|nr:methyl-accepting chemotaxis protein [Synergistaceae bacterium]
MMKVMFLVVVMTSLMVVVALTGYFTSNRIAFRMQDTYEGYTKTALKLTEIAGLAETNRILVINMMNMRYDNEVAEAEKTILENRKAILEVRSVLNQERMSPKVQKLFERTMQLGPSNREAQDEIIKTAKTQEGRNKLLDRFASKGDEGFLDVEYLDGLKALAADLVQSSDAMNAEASVFARARAVVIAVTSAIAILLGVILSVLISRTITVPINKIMDSVKQFSKGDIGVEFPAEGKDELGVMGRELENMSENLRHIIISIKESSSEINETSKEFTNMAQDTTSSVQGFRSALDDTGNNLTSLAATGEEVNASVEEVAAGAQATAEKGTDIARKVDDAMKAGDDGMSSVRRAVSGIEGVVGNASSTAKSVQELGERTHQIQNFVSQIGGIADQTNLLALNAAIEAARAGEAGRGFAVVAEEVRKLAEESNMAAKNIEDLAKTIMGDLDVVVNMSLENAKASEDAKKLSSDTETIIGHMISYLKDIAGATQDLAAVSEEQAASSEEIAEAVQNISIKVSSAADNGDNIRDRVGGVAKTAERMAVGADGLTKLAHNLEKLLSFFKMGSVSIDRPGGKRLSLK